MPSPFKLHGGQALKQRGQGAKRAKGPVKRRETGNHQGRSIDSCRYVMVTSKNLHRSRRAGEHRRRRRVTWRVADTLFACPAMAKAGDTARAKRESATQNDNRRPQHAAGARGIMAFCLPPRILLLLQQQDTGHWHAHAQQLRKGRPPTLLVLSLR